MKKLPILLVCMGLCLHAFAQEIPSYILPEDQYDFAGTDALERITALSRDMAQGKDPSFAAVSSIFPHYMDYPKALVGIKEHHGRFLTSWDGAVIFPPHYLSFEVWEEGTFSQMRIEPVPFSSTEVEKRGESLEGDWLPVVSRKFSYHAVDYDQTVMAVSQEFDTDKPLIAWVRMKVTNRSARKKTQELSIHFQGTGSRPSTQIWATSGRVIVNSPMLLRQDAHRILNENGDAVLWSNRSDGYFGENRLSYRLTLPPETSDTLYFCIPFEPVSKNSAALIGDGEYDATFLAVKDYWTGILEGGMLIDVPEKAVNDAYRTWLENNFLLVQEDKLRMTYKTIDAPFFYEGIFGYAAAMYLNTITTAGFFGEAKKCADMFLKLQRPDGSISGVNRSNSIIPHQHGAILYAISQIYRMGRDEAWFASIVPDLVRGCDWIITQRKSNPAGVRDIGYGLLPKMRSNVDNGDGTQEYCGNAWCWAGMNEVGLALSEMGGSYAREGRRLLREAQAYRADILASMDKAAVERDGVRFIPLDIAVREPYPYAMTNTESYYYTMISSRMLESMIFDRDDPRMEAFTNYFEHYKGIILGLCRQKSANKLGYTAHFSAGYGISNLRMGKLDRSLLNFYSMFSYGQARNLYATQEHDNFRLGKNDSWYYARQPHLHSTSELLRVTTKMLIYEERNAICLAFGIPRAWLEDGKSVAVKRAQTCFGPVSFRIDSRVATGKMHVRVEHQPGGGTPHTILLKLRHPDGKPISKVEIDGRKWSDFGPETVTLPAGTTGSDIAVSF